MQYFGHFFAKIMVYVIIESQSLRLMFLNYKIASSSMFLLPNKIYVVIVIRYSIRYGPFCVTYGFVLLKWFSYKSIYSLVIFVLGQIFQNEMLKSLIFSEYYKKFSLAQNLVVSMNQSVVRKMTQFCPIPSQAPW